jgi:peroxiredoxin
MRQTGVRTVGIAALLAAGVLQVGAGAETAPAVNFAPKGQMAAMKVGQTPTVGQKAPDFALMSLDGVQVRLSEEIARGPVTLVVLRGFPTYQCPFCTRQFADYLAHGDDFQATGAHVLFVYPGSPEGLNEHAKALVAGRPMPAGYRILMDPDYAFTLAYNLRWDAPRETAYPSTFVIDRHGMVAFAQTSRAHDGRVPTAVGCPAAVTGWLNIGWGYRKR